MAGTAVGIREVGMLADTQVATPECIPAIPALHIITIMVIVPIRGSVGMGFGGMALAVIAWAGMDPRSVTADLVTP